MAGTPLRCVALDMGYSFLPFCRYSVDGWVRGRERRRPGAGSPPLGGGIARDSVERKGAAGRGSRARDHAAGEASGCGAGAWGSFRVARCCGDWRSQGKGARNRLGGSWCARRRDAGASAGCGGATWGAGTLAA